MSFVLQIQGTLHEKRRWSCSVGNGSNYGGSNLIDRAPTASARLRRPPHGRGGRRGTQPKTKTKLSDFLKTDTELTNFTQAASMFHMHGTLQEGQHVLGRQHVGCNVYCTWYIPESVRRDSEFDSPNRPQQTAGTTLYHSMAEYLRNNCCQQRFYNAYRAERRTIICNQTASGDVTAWLCHNRKMKMQPRTLFQTRRDIMYSISTREWSTFKDLFSGSKYQYVWEKLQLKI